MTSRLMRPARRLLNDERGSTATLFGLMAVPVLAMVGVAIDYGRAVHLREQLQRISDTATTAGLREYEVSGNADLAKKRMLAYVNAGLQNIGHSLKTDSNKSGTVKLLNANIDPTNSSVSPTLQGGVETVVLQLIGIKSLKVKAGTKAAVATTHDQGTKALELSLMLDTSGSMEGEKFTDMKEAAADFLNIVMPDDLAVENRKVGLVPFSTKVNLGSRALAAAATGLAETSTAMADTGRDIFSTSSFRWRSLSRCRDDVRRVFPNYSSTQAQNYCIANFDTRYSWSGTEYWTPRVENEMAPVATNLITCVTERSGDYAYTDAAPATGSFVGPTYKNYTTEYQYSETGDCIISDQPQAAIVPLTTSKSALQTAINEMEITGGTAGHVGTAWAYYMLSPLWNAFWGQNVEAYDHPDTIKAAVLMTDGQYNSNYGETSASAQAIAICEQMKANNITVFTIGFDMSTDQNDPARQTLMQCASPGKYYFPYTGEALREAFQEIGNSLVSIVTVSNDGTRVVLQE